MAFSPDGRYIASGSGDKKVALWRQPHGDRPFYLEGHAAWVRCVAFSPQGHLLASASNDNTIGLWDVR
ncbi:MAG: serine/threonine protein kinase, partial [Cyanobacteria bacterium P01_A01_bin.70]